MLTRRWFNLGRTMAELTNIDRLIDDDHVTVEDADGYRRVLDGPAPLNALSVPPGDWGLLAAHIKASTDRPGLGIYHPPEDPPQAATRQQPRSSYLGPDSTGDRAGRRGPEPPTGQDDTEEGPG